MQPLSWVVTILALEGGRGARSGGGRVGFGQWESNWGELVFHWGLSFTGVEVA